jgi:aryl-alcohol dehydrogenase-like predicted oxidoreductase
MTADPSPWLTPRSSSLASPASADGPRAAALSVGTMNFGKRTPEAEAHRVVRRALERGLRFFDTANVYNNGESERILGRALGKDRKEAFLATKVGLAGIPKAREGLGAAAIGKAIDESLARLGTDHVDLYYLHAPDPDVPIEETVVAMKGVLDAGKARAWGVSNYASWQILEINAIADAHDMPRPVVAQMLYNVLIRQLEVEYFAFARRFPIHTTVYNPLAGGLLAGKHREETVPAGSRFDKNALYMKRYWTKRLFELVDAIGGVAREEGLGLVELSYAWLADRPGVDSILLGPGDVAQLDAGIDGAAKTLSQQAVRRLDELHLAFTGTDARYAR